jgi:uncharacterized protein (DUF2252 family)
VSTALTSDFAGGTTQFQPGDSSKKIEICNSEGGNMWDTRAVELRVNLPGTVAAEVEEVQRRDPELLSRMVYYAVTRRTIFDHLSAHAGLAISTEPLTSHTP